VATIGDVSLNVSLRRSLNFRGERERASFRFVLFCRGALHHNGLLF